MSVDVLMYDFPLSICCQMVRLTLAEKGVTYNRHPIDIMDASEQFEPWYTALNPKAVVPTLVIDGEVVTDSIRIVQRIDSAFDGPDLTPSEPERASVMREWLRDIMAPHYGVLLYGRRLDAERRSSTVMSRLEGLLALREARPESAELLETRIAGNRRFQAMLLDADACERVIDGVHQLVVRIDGALAETAFLDAPSYTLADAFCTAALARFDMHGYGGWWEDGALPNVERYYAQMQARPSWTHAGVLNRSSGH